MLMEERAYVYGDEQEVAELTDAVEVRVGSLTADDLGSFALDDDAENIGSIEGDTITLMSIEGDTIRAVSEGVPSAGGTKDYNELINKPQIEGVTLEGNKTYEELNLERVTNSEMEEIFRL